MGAENNSVNQQQTSGNRLFDMASKTKEKISAGWSKTEDYVIDKAVKTRDFLFKRDQENQNESAPLPKTAPKPEAIEIEDESFFKKGLQAVKDVASDSKEFVSETIDKKRILDENREVLTAPDKESMQKWLKGLTLKEKNNFGKLIRDDLKWVTLNFPKNAFRLGDDAASKLGRIIYDNVGNIMYGTQLDREIAFSGSAVTSIPAGLNAVLDENAPNTEGKPWYEKIVAHVVGFFKSGFDLITNFFSSDEDKGASNTIKKVVGNFRKGAKDISNETVRKVLEERLEDIENDLRAMTVGEGDDKKGLTEEFIVMMKDEIKKSMLEETKKQGYNIVFSDTTPESEVAESNQHKQEDITTVSTTPEAEEIPPGTDLPSPQTPPAPDEKISLNANSPAHAVGN